MNRRNHRVESSMHWCIVFRSIAAWSDHGPLLARVVHRPSISCHCICGVPWSVVPSNPKTCTSLLLWHLWWYTEKAPYAWQRRGTQKTRNIYNQPNRPNRKTSQTKHQALPKGQPGRRITPINTAAVHASAQQQPTISTHTRQGHHQIFSANAARCEAQEQYRRAG